jgi:DNA-directed RNA polymerase subunit RPC12/RpoP
MKRSTKPKVIRVARTRNGGTETDSQHMGKIRSALRNISRWWKPFQIALKLSGVKCNIGGRIKTLYLCAKCRRMLERKSVEVNHIIPVGSLKNYHDLPGFCERLFVEDPKSLEVVCKDCHLEITQEQRKKI